MAQQRLYERVADDLARQILGGAFEVGARLPSERLLAEQYDVSRPTIREAVIALEVDGLVEVMTGSGVYVRATTRANGRAAPMDIGPFELLEARAAIEGESAALAALRISDSQLRSLTVLVEEMAAENKRDVVMSEDADRRFHLAIAEATQNSAIMHVVTELWDARERSLQSVKFLQKARAEGVKPRIDEHAAIVDALTTRDPERARQAMRRHLEGVADMVFAATEAEAVERARAQVAAARNRYRVGSGG